MILKTIIIFLIIWWIIFINIFLTTKNINLEQIKSSIVIIIPESKLISYKENPDWLFEDYKDSWIWAWFFIDSKWTIQTVNHLVEDDKIKYKVICNNDEYNAIVISRNKEKDLAILKIVSKERILFPHLTKEGVRVWSDNNVTSFWIDTEALEIIYNTWTIINKKSKLDNMSNLLEISNNLKPGFSWWPIINSDWKVIWINYAISGWKNYWIKFY